MPRYPLTWGARQPAHPPSLPPPRRPPEQCHKEGDVLLLIGHLQTAHRAPEPRVQPHLQRIDAALQHLVCAQAGGRSLAAVSGAWPCKKHQAAGTGAAPAATATPARDRCSQNDANKTVARHRRRRHRQQHAVAGAEQRDLSRRPTVTAICHSRAATLCLASALLPAAVAGQGAHLRSCSPPCCGTGRTSSAVRPGGRGGSGAVPRSHWGQRWPGTPAHEAQVGTRQCRYPIAIKWCHQVGNTFRWRVLPELAA